MDIAGEALLAWEGVRVWVGGAAVAIFDGYGGEGGHGCCGRVWRSSTLRGSLAYVLRSWFVFGRAG